MHAWYESLICGTPADEDNEDEARGGRWEGEDEEEEMNCVEERKWRGGRNKRWMSRKRKRR